jgi:hypothetical protein
VGKQGDRAAATAAVERWRRRQHNNGSGSGGAAWAERWRQRSSSAATVGNSAAASAARGRQRQRSGGVRCGENHEFFYPWGRERVQIPVGRAYVKILYQAYDLLKKNESAHFLSTFMSTDFKSVDFSRQNKKSTDHHLPALISSYLAGDNISSKNLPATKDSTV